MTLRRVLGSSDAAWLVAGNMIGAGIFYTPGLVAGWLPGGSWPLVAWLLGGLCALCGAAVYAELGARLPRAGGDYQYLTVAFGPAWGFLTGWTAMILTFSAAAAAMAIVAVDYARTAAPALERVPVWLVAPGFVLLLTLANVGGARVAGRTTVWFTALPVAGVLGLFAWGVLAGQADVRWPAAAAPARAWPVAFGAAMLPVFFTYAGWNAAAYVAGELREPARSLPRGLLWGTLGVTLLYVGLNAVLLAAVPQERLAGSTTAGVDAAAVLLEPVAARALALCIAVAVLGSVNVTLMAGARIYYAMALDGLAPRALGRTGRAGVPSAALWAGGVWSAILSLTHGVERLVNWASLAMVLMSSLVVVSLSVLRRRGGPEPGYRCIAYPWAAALYLGVSLAVAWASAWIFPLESLYGVLIAALAFPVYAVAVRRFRARATRSDLR